MCFAVVFTGWELGEKLAYKSKEGVKVMGGFSIWHWLIVLLVLVVPVIVIARVSANSVIALDRYRFWAITYLALCFSLAVSASIHALLFLVVFFIFYVFQLFWIYYSAKRLQALNHNKWWLLFTLLPGLSLVYATVLTFLRSDNEGGGAPQVQVR